jgi:hypothetical protein
MYFLCEPLQKLCDTLRDSIKEVSRKEQQSGAENAKKRFKNID